MKIILVKETENGFLHEVVKVVYKDYPSKFTFRGVVQLQIVGKMIANETDKNKQNIIISDFSNIQDILGFYLGRDYDYDNINSNKNINREDLIRTYLAMIASKYGLSLIDLKKDKDLYELYKEGIYIKKQFNNDNKGIRDNLIPKLIFSYRVGGIPIMNIEYDKETSQRPIPVSAFANAKELVYTINPITGQKAYFAIKNKSK